MPDREMLFREALSLATAEEMRRDDSVFVMGEDVGASGGVFKCCEGLFEEFGAERVIDTATYDDPRQYPVGIPYVLVNGRVAVDQEKCTGVLAGQAVP